jgi:hypothetical protein
MSDIFISQYVRMLYPCILKYINGVLITDINMIPMNSEYYIYNILELPGDSFVSYRDELMEESQQIPLCYYVANSNTWSELFDISNIENIQTRLIEKYDGIVRRDQIDLYLHIKYFQQKYPQRTFILTDRITGFRRMNPDLLLTNDVKRHILNRKYTDYHIYHPYYKYILMNESILELLQVSTVNEYYF